MQYKQTDIGIQQNYIAYGHSSWLAWRRLSRWLFSGIWHRVVGVKVYRRVQLTRRLHLDGSKMVVEHSLKKKFCKFIPVYTASHHRINLFTRHQAVQKVLFWVVIHCGLLSACQCFGRTYCLHHQPEGGSSKFVRNTDIYLQEYTVLQTKRGYYRVIASAGTIYFRIIPLLQMRIFRSKTLNLMGLICKYVNYRSFKFV